MVVSDLFAALSRQELSNLAVGNSGAGDIIETKKPQIIGYLNTALLKLYSRFILAEGEVVVEQIENKRDYLLSSVYSIHNPDPLITTKYIIDNVDDRFRDDVIKILQVVEAGGTPLPLNDVEDSKSMFTPQPKILQVPNPVAGWSLGIVYQARHVPIALDDFDAGIEIPEVLEDALRYYIAHLAYSDMNGQENLLKASELKNRYEEACETVKQMDLVSTSISTTNTRFERGGWI